MSIWEVLPQGKNVKKSHSNQCSVCLNKHCKEIERDFLMGRPISGIEGEYGVKKTPIYNHMHLRGFSEFRSKNPLTAIRWLAEEMAGEVKYRGADVVRMYELLAKNLGQLGPESTVTVNQNIAQFGELVKDFTEEDLKKLREEARKRKESEKLPDLV